MFNASNWEMSFAEQARVIMHQAPGSFTGAPPAWMQAELPPPSGHSTSNETAIPGASNPLQLVINSNSTDFQIRAIMGRCEIGSGANFVAALAICDRLVIRNRTTPLTIVGTFVVGSLEFEGQAARANIRWYSLKHPDAAGLLINAGILRLPPYAILNRNNDALITTNLNCDFTVAELQNNPVWKPVVPLPVATKRQMCGTQSLISVQAFTWSEMNPAAGYTSATAVRPSMREILSRFFPFALYEGVR
jgi:hypothetical protein